MNNKPKLWIFLYTFFISFFLSAQISDSQKIKSLEEKIIENNDLMMRNPEAAFGEIESLMQQALKDGNHQAELSLLSRRCWYYIRKTDLKNALASAQKLKEKAEFYKDNFWQAYAHQYFMEVYSHNNLLDKAVSEFEKSIEFLDKSDRSSDDINYAKATAHVKVAEVYEIRKDFGRAKEMLLSADKYIRKTNDSTRKRKFMFFNYSNLGAVNHDLGALDSAEYYILESISLDEQENIPSLIQFRNHFLLGLILNNKNNISDSYSNLKLAENILTTVPASLVEKETLYKELSDVYTKMDSSNQAGIYFNKQRDIQLEMEKSKNSSLHKIIKDDMLKEKNYSLLYIIVGTSVLLLVSLVFIFKLYKKNKIIALQEKNSQQYLKEIEQLPYKYEQSYKELLEMAQNDDPAFLDAFHKVFPVFLDKLLAFDKSMATTEIEFCALLRLNIPTKEIAQYKNIEPKSVQNKKYRIRKKLNIPDNEDIYYWFNKL